MWTLVGDVDCYLLFWGYCDIDFDLSSIQIVYRAYLLYYVRYGYPKLDTRIQIQVLEWCMLCEGTVTLTFLSVYEKRIHNIFPTCFEYAVSNFAYGCSLMLEITAYYFGNHG